MKKALLLALALIAAGCSSSNLTPITTVNPPSPPITAIAMAPSGGILADAVGISLLNYGVTVFDTQQTANLMLRLNLDEIEILSPQNLSRLYENGVEAVMFVSVIGFPNEPEGASVRIIHALDGTLVGGVAWQSADGWWSGAATGLVEASSEIAEELATQMGWL